MCNPATVLMLVAMLSSSAAARVPINPEIIGAPEVSSKMLCRAKNGNGYRRCVDASASLSRRNPLDTVAARFVIEPPQIFSRNGDREIAIGVTLSANAVTEFAVSRKKVAGKLPTVIPALCGANFQDSFHLSLLF